MVSKCQGEGRDIFCPSSLLALTAWVYSEPDPVPGSSGGTCCPGWHPLSNLRLCLGPLRRSPLSGPGVAQGSTWPPKQPSSEGVHPREVPCPPRLSPWREMPVPGAQAECEGLEKNPPVGQNAQTLCPQHSHLRAAWHCHRGLRRAPAMRFPTTNNPKAPQGWVQPRNPRSQHQDCLPRTPLVLPQAVLATPGVPTLPEGARRRVSARGERGTARERH